MYISVGPHFKSVGKPIYTERNHQTGTSEDVRNIKLSAFWISGAVENSQARIVGGDSSLTEGDGVIVSGVSLGLPQESETCWVGRRQTYEFRAASHSYIKQ
ncbi:unnamed protein product [Lactuca virosa]|uniref:Uncharacterized protein n=1 Tax=Lactuca virosa TaxID=75947 RepID=A0AAU9NN60_9ASTR|nr:unnamed protein product [Lactuca virosa]